MAFSQLDISNMALVEVPAGTIVSVNENSLSAIEARRSFAPVVAEFLEEFGYDLAITRVTLAVTTNDRPSEWGYAYATPDNMAFPLRLIPDYNAGSGALVLLAGQTLAPVGNLASGDPFRISYIVAEGLIYANEPNATLEFVRNDPAIDLFPAQLVRAIALEMAARMVMPLLKSETRERTVMGKAELARQRAIAANLNRKPNTNRLPASESELARDGWYN